MASDCEEGVPRGRGYTRETVDTDVDLARKYEDGGHNVKSMPESG